MTTRKIAITTTGGDAPGLNAVVRAATLSALELGHEVWGIRRGCNGLFSDGGVVQLSRDSVRGIAHLGGTILGATNCADPFHHPTTDGPQDRSKEFIELFRARGLEALIAIGGDGSMRLAKDLVALGLPLVIGVPKTIDNDVLGTDVTFGFDTAVSIATEALDRLHTTAEAHDRVMVVEVMGRDAGWIATCAGLGGGADAILIPEIPFDLGIIAEKIAQRERRGRAFSIVVVAEGARPIGDPLEGRVGDHVAEALAKLTGKETRALALGHLLRGGPPTSRDRVLALELGTQAALAVEDRIHRANLDPRVDSGMVGVAGEHFTIVSLDVPSSGTRLVPTDGTLVTSARHLGIAFGDEAQGFFGA